MSILYTATVPGESAWKLGRHRACPRVVHFFNADHGALSAWRQTTGLPPAARVRRAPEDLVPGTFVTVSESKRVADRSLVYAIWEILAVNEAHVVLRLHGPAQPVDEMMATRVVPLHEHDFYRADQLATAVEPISKGSPGAVVRLCRD